MVVVATTCMMVGERKLTRCMHACIVALVVVRVGEKRRWT